MDSFGVPPQEQKFSFVDDEGDKCLVATAGELKEAIRFFGGAPVKLSLEVRPSVVANSPSPAPSAPSAPLPPLPPAPTLGPASIQPLPFLSVENQSEKSSKKAGSKAEKGSKKVKAEKGSKKAEKGSKKAKAKAGSKKVKKASSKPDVITVDKKAGLIHEGIRCDGCQQYPLVGARFKCTVCPDFDLCQTCEAQGLHVADHSMIKLRVPQPQVNFRHLHARPCNRTPLWAELVAAANSQYQPQQQEGSSTEETEGVPCVRNEHRLRGRGGRASSSSSSSSSAKMSSKKARRKAWKTLMRRSSSSSSSSSSSEAHSKKKHLKAKALAGTAWKVIKRNLQGLKQQWKRGSGPQAEFVEDVTIPDGSVLEAGSVVTKTWSIKNTGATPWPAETVLQHVRRHKAHRVSPLDDVAVKVPAADPGQTVQVSVDVRIPKEGEKRTGFFRLFAGTERKFKFGHKLWIEVKSVKSQAAPAALAQPAPKSALFQLDPELVPQLALISSLGFPVEPEALQLMLQQAGGDVQRVVEFLLSEPRRAAHQ
jgi:hypothetical protein